MGYNKVQSATKTFIGNSIDSAKLVLETNPVSTQIPINLFECVLKSDEQLDEIILAGDKILVSHIDDNGSLRNFGDWYVTDVKQRSANSYVIYAQDGIGFVNDGPKHNGGIYTGATARTVITDIMGTSVPYTISDSIANTAINNWLPIADRRDNLIQVLVSVGGVVRRDGNGGLLFTSPQTQISGSFENNEVYLNPSRPRTIPASRFDLTQYTYLRSSTTEAETIYEGAISGETQISFDSPYHTLTIANGTIVESGPNYAKITGSGNVVLTGIPYMRFTQIVSAANPTATKESVKSVAACNLISSVNSGMVADYMIDYLSHADTIDADVFVTNQAPGDVVQIRHPYTGEMTFGTIESMMINMTSILKAAVIIRIGYLGVRAKAFNTVDVITTSKTWTAPTGVTKIKVVAIQGGSGGASGGYGEAGGESHSTVTYGYNRWNQPGVGGDGGNGGGAGNAGFVYESGDLNISSGAMFTVVIGAAGIGGSGSTSSEGTAGTSGGHSMFYGPGAVSITSASGSMLDYGYLEQLSGVLYALPATDGKNGGAGGDGAMTVTDDGKVVNEEYGHPGEDVGGYLGGSGGAIGEAYITSSLWADFGGGGGSGAVIGINGKNGEVGQYVYAAGYTIYGGNGGNGITPAKPITQSAYGSGGHGGHGGSGGGGGGAVRIYRVSGSSMVIGGSYGGAASAGGAGGNGAQGCVLIYYAR